MDFMFSVPTLAFFGPGKSEMVGDMLKGMGAKKILVVYDLGVKAAGIVDKVLANVKAAGIEYAEYSDVVPNPPEYLVNQGYEIAKDLNIDAMLAVGGGSSIDFAKAVNILLTNPGPFSQYNGVNLVKNPVKPLIAIPTTAGTGSEVTNACVITDTVNKEKMTILGQYVAPTIALVDPNLTLGLPPAITASTGMDALTHAIEAYLSKWASPASDSLAICAIELIGRSIEKAVNQGSDLNAREDMIVGSAIAGMAFSQTDLGLAHAIAAPMGANCGTPHGVANAIVLGLSLEYNLPSCAAKMKLVGKALGLKVDSLSDDEAGALTVKRINEISKNINIPTLKEVGVTEDKFEVIAEGALINSAARTNPREVTKECVIEILRKAF